MPSIVECLTMESDRVISIVGGGGKTSLMFYLAHALQQKGLRVISTTTTRILKPTSRQSAEVILFAHERFGQTLQQCLGRYGHVTVAQSLLEGGDKLQGLTCHELGDILDHTPVERMVIEADGARQLSFKAPGENEPVVSERTDSFIGVIGLDIIGKPLVEEYVFRAELVSALTGQRLGTEITPLTVARLTIHPQGLLKGCPGKARSTVLLNKTDIAGGREKGLAVMAAARVLEGKKPDLWLAASIREGSCERYSGEV